MINPIHITVITHKYLIIETRDGIKYSEDGINFTTLASTIDRNKIGTSVGVRGDKGDRIDEIEGFMRKKRQSNN